jgi:hypothetical protein
MLSAENLFTDGNNIKKTPDGRQISEVFRANIFFVNFFEKSLEPYNPWYQDGGVPLLMGGFRLKESPVFPINKRCFSTFLRDFLSLEGRATTREKPKPEGIP